SMNILSNVILLHLSEDTRNVLKNQGINNLIAGVYKHPLFNYIRFWRYLNLSIIEKVISSKEIEMSKMFIIGNEILKLFINRNTKFIHLSMRQDCNYQLHRIPETEHCFSDLESFQCDDKIN